MKNIKNLLAIVVFLLIWQTVSYAQESTDKLFQVKGFCIGAPNPKGVDRFIKFINEELAPRGVNTLLLLVDYNYQFESYPQLRDTSALSKADVKKMVSASENN